MTGKEPVIIGYRAFDPKYVSLEAPAYGWLHLPLVEPDLTNANANFWRKAAASTPIL